MFLMAAEGCCANLPVWAVPAGTALAGFVAGVLVGKFGCKGGSKSAPRKGASPVAGVSGKDCVEIYVGNLSYDMTEDQMRKEFEKFGTVFSARIISNRFNQKSKGFGFVEMPNRPEAEAAIKALNDKDVQGRKLRVNEAKNKSRE